MAFLVVLVFGLVVVIVVVVVVLNGKCIELMEKKLSVRCEEYERNGGGSFF